MFPIVLKVQNVARQTVTNILIPENVIPFWTLVRFAIGMKSWFLLLVCSPCISEPVRKLFGLSITNSMKDSICWQGTGKISSFLYNKTSNVCVSVTFSCIHVVISVVEKQ